MTGGPTFPRGEGPAGSSSLPFFRDRRWLAFLIFSSILLLTFHSILAALLGLALSSDERSYLLAIPFLFAALLAKSTPGSPPGGLKPRYPGILPVLAGLALLNAGLPLSAGVSALILSLAGGYIVFFGLAAFRATLYPWGFLLLEIPIPERWIGAAVSFLQNASAKGTEIFFALLGFPFIREGQVFALPGANIDIAPECSGIRSSTALLLISLFTAKWLLGKAWSRTLLVLAVVPLAILKNSLRITVLTWLGTNVDPGFLSGSLLHTRGGFVFFGAALLLLGSLLLLLRRLEARGVPPDVQRDAPKDGIDPMAGK